jgi:hypothetical protein
MIAKLAIVVLSGTFAAAAFGQASNAPPDISGSWVNTANGANKMVLTEKDGKLRVQEFNGGDKPAADYLCALDGRECAVKEDGRSEKVMVYFNGPKLVEIKERGNDTVKRRFTLSADGKTLEVEMVPLSGEQKPEKLTFQLATPANGKTGS